MDSAFVGKAPTLLFQGSRQWRYINSKNTPAYGETVQFDLGRLGTFLGQTVIEIELSALSSGTTPEYIDYFPYVLISEVQIEVAGQKLQTIRGLEMFMMHNITRQSEHLYQGMVFGGLSRAARAAASGATVRAWVPLPAFWTGSLASYLPYLDTVVNTPISITIQLSSLNEIHANNGGTTTGTINRIRVLQEYVHALRSETKAMISEIGSVNSVLGSAGYSRLVTTFARINNQTLSATTDEQEIALDRIQLPVKALFVLFRTSTNVPSSASSYGFTAQGAFAFNSVDRLRATINGDPLWPECACHSHPHAHETTLCGPRRYGRRPNAHAEAVADRRDRLLPQSTPTSCSST